MRLHPRDTVYVKIICKITEHFPSNIRKLVAVDKDFYSSLKMYFGNTFSDANPQSIFFNGIFVCEGSASSAAYVLRGCSHFRQHSFMLLPNILDGVVPVIYRVRME